MCILVGECKVRCCIKKIMPVPCTRTCGCQNPLELRSKHARPGAIQRLVIYCHWEVRGFGGKRGQVRGVWWQKGTILNRAILGRCNWYQSTTLVYMVGATSRILMSHILNPGVGAKCCTKLSATSWPSGEGCWANAEGGGW